MSAPVASDAPVVGTYACRVDDVPLGEGRAITLDGRRIAIFRASGAAGTRSTPPARIAAGPLADGIVCDRSVICPLHDRRFDLAQRGRAERRRAASSRMTSSCAASASS